MTVLGLALALAAAVCVQVVKLTTAPEPTRPAGQQPPPDQNRLFFEVEKEQGPTTNVDIDGKTYPNSQGVQFCSGARQDWPYEIQGKYAKFHAVLGLTGTANPDTVVTFQVIPDPGVQVPKVVAIGHHEEIDISLANVQHLRLVTTLVGNQAHCTNLTAHWADAKVVLSKPLQAK